MGATPCWFNLALTMPRFDQDWLAGFCQGMYELANRHHLQLIGGDLSRGPLTITICAMGIVPEGAALKRKGAKVGDDIYVTGTLGDAGLGLSLRNQDMAARNKDYSQYILSRLDYPTPRVAAGEALRDIAHAAIDISDGLAADLSHILAQSMGSARIAIDLLPLSTELRQSVSAEQAIAYALTAGDDYELCFTTAPHCAPQLKKILALSGTPFHYIGQITAQGSSFLTLTYSDGTTYHGKVPAPGYQHF
jgi:thiamine-monophosphate kinase